MQHKKHTLYSVTWKWLVQLDVWLLAGGIYDSPCCEKEKQITLDHGIVVVGYGTENGTDFWVLKNRCAQQSRSCWIAAILQGVHLRHCLLYQPLTPPTGVAVFFLLYRGLCFLRNFLHHPLKQHAHEFQLGRQVGRAGALGICGSAVEGADSTSERAHVCWL